MNNIKEDNNTVNTSKSQNKFKQGLDSFLLKIGFEKINYYDLFLNIVFIIVGSYLVSFALRVFLFPLKISSGGISGIANILFYFFKIPLGMTVLLINIPLFAVAIKTLGLKFSIKTIFSTLMFSVFLDTFDYTSLSHYLKDDLFISSVYGGAILGLGSAILLKAGASSGGTDALARIIYRVTKVQSYTKVLLAVDTLVIISTMVAFKNINIGLYSILVIFISKNVIDLIFEGESNVRVANIITRQGREIADDIIHDLQRGVTIIDSHGAYTDKEYSVLTVTLMIRELSKLKKIVEHHDKEAFVYIVKASEAIGRGFKNF